MIIKNISCFFKELPEISDSDNSVIYKPPDWKVSGNMFVCQCVMAIIQLQYLSGPLLLPSLCLSEPLYS